MTANRSRAAAVATADSSLTAFVANGNYSTAARRRDVTGRRPVETGAGPRVL
jgi:hypothetical protein